MNPHRRAMLELGLACVALICSGLSWRHSHHMVTVAPIASGQPSTTSLTYDPQLLLLTLVLLTGAGVLAIVGIARLRRARSRPTAAS
ncbi:hypothetical protein [Mycobacterium sp. 1165178.9]|uniref:hypothetical protein n=1 Tax=Mycobacterium sp. 1165178.9 TaxID=1834070 RepID=UPI0007FBD640|nr:hypothetical protein [Mycobacterium sp. 1165178.9]OBK74239.1 hypothetical protein A5652_20650 [Mycobacterium sp. 1165178.9]